MRAGDYMQDKDDDYLEEAISEADEAFSAFKEAVRGALDDATVFNIDLSHEGVTLFNASANPIRTFSLDAACEGWLSSEGEGRSQEQIDECVDTLTRTANELTRCATLFRKAAARERKRQPIL